MPVVEDPSRAQGRLLIDAGGDPIATFTLGERDGRPHAHLFAVADGVEPERAAAAVTAELPGWRVSGEEPFGRSGRLMGPLLRCSALAVDEGGDVVGAILVNGKPGDPPLDGPWISDVFRRPGARGVGGALTRRALAVATRDGLPAIGLAVTHENRARGLYAALGFADVLRVLNVVV